MKRRKEESKKAPPPGVDSDCSQSILSSSFAALLVQIPRPRSPRFRFEKVIVFLCCLVGLTAAQYGHGGSGYGPDGVRNRYFIFGPRTRPHFHFHRKRYLWHFPRTSQVQLQTLRGHSDDSMVRPDMPQLPHTKLQLQYTMLQLSLPCCSPCLPCPSSSLPCPSSCSVYHAPAPVYRAPAPVYHAPAPAVDHGLYGPSANQGYGGGYGGSSYGGGYGGSSYGGEDMEVLHTDTDDLVSCYPLTHPKISFFNFQ
ncbi:hypothetical protein CEXT_592791 [Caerostris extrusa]|uniref:Uncharacterized protein n=1 Tax=Caerostris extrusa TaxID=172846 RepID=A0AAV4MPX0_CAEEX|nr:hypothetical protein CEXT_592791 [Caerostris extrusa]